MRFLSFSLSVARLVVTVIEDYKNLTETNFYCSGVSIIESNITGTFITLGLWFFFNLTSLPRVDGVETR